MVGTIFLILAVVMVVIVMTLGVTLAWALGENRSDEQQRGFLKLVRKWLGQRPAKLDYRRDKKGRFRKVRRG